MILSFIRSSLVEATRAPFPSFDIVPIIAYDINDLPRPLFIADPRVGQLEALGRTGAVVALVRPDALP